MWADLFKIRTGDLFVFRLQMIGSSDPFWALPAKRLGSHSKISGVASPGKWFGSQQNPSSYLIGFYREHLLATFTLPLPPTLRYLSTSSTVMSDGPLQQSTLVACVDQASTANCSIRSLLSRQRRGGYHEDSRS